MVPETIGIAEGFDTKNWEILQNIFLPICASRSLQSCNIYMNYSRYRTGSF